MGFSGSLLPVGKNMQKMHGSHACAPLTKSIRVIYLMIIGGRILIQFKDGLKSFGHKGHTSSCSRKFVRLLLLPSRQIWNMILSFSGTPPPSPGKTGQLC
jgi:hypothetical protein